MGRLGDAWKVRVAAPPEGGRANAEALAALAAAVGVPRANVTLVAGRSAPDKVFEVDGLSDVEVERRLDVRSAREDGRR